MGISLWLVPSPSTPEATALQDVIVSLSKTYSSPTFPPHVTLASVPEHVTLPEIISCLSSEDALELSFETVRSGDTFYQSVFATIHLSPILDNLHNRVHNALGLQPKTSEFPHLSLYYGDGGKTEVLRTLREDGVVQSFGPTRTKVNGVDGFLAKEVWVVDCQGRPEGWKVLKKIDMRTRES